MAEDAYAARRLHVEVLGRRREEEDHADQLRATQRVRAATIVRFHGDLYGPHRVAIWAAKRKVNANEKRQMHEAEKGVTPITWPSWSA